MIQATRETHERFQTLSQRLSDLGSTIEALTWDQETIMPPKGGEFRARQIATLASLRHGILISEEYVDLLRQISPDQGDEWTRADLREAGRECAKARRLPASLVREIAHTTSLAYDAWVDARRSSDFKAFSPWLEKVFSLKREEARCLSIGSTPYDSLLDYFEAGATEERLWSVFSRLRPQLTELLQRIQNAPGQPCEQWLKGVYPTQAQRTFGREILTSMGFDWGCGRLDVSPHPFCAGLTPRDVRITTRYREDDFTVSIFGMIHEGGHALYEQGICAERFGMPAAEAVSLGVHESQSRLWENLVGRSRDFWVHWYPRLKESFPGQFDTLPLDDFVRGINRVEAGLIRVEADEVSYGLHVILRFQLERELLSGDLEVSAAEERWNDLMQEYLGIRPPDAASGVLQDVHWSSGLIGYFPTYLLGTIYATQIFDKAEEELPDLREEIRNGEFSRLREWLRTHIHVRGKLYEAEELIRKVTGSGLDESQFMEYLKKKYEKLYAL